MPNNNPHKRTYGQYFTPGPVVHCCYDLLAGYVPANPRIADPACGDGAFLKAAWERGIAAPPALRGCDLDAALVEALHREGLAGVYCADGLDAASLPAATFDLVVGNPPFGVATSPGKHQIASEVRFLLRALDLARPGGYVALVLPNGIFANERLQTLRAELLARATVLAVVALPRETFRGTGTHAACSLLVVRCTPPPPGHQVFCALPASLGELPAVVAAFRARPGLAAPPSGAHYWQPQGSPLIQRLDAQFWQPAQRALLECMAARWPLRALAHLLDRRRELIAGDHVRRSRGEAKGPLLPYEYYQTREFLPAGYNYAQIEHCNAQAYARLKRTAVQQHDILVSCAGVGGAGRGRVCLVTHVPGASCTGDVLIIRAHQIEPIFLFLLLCSRAGREQLLRLQNGVGTVNLSTAELLQVQVPLLPAAYQRHLAQGYQPVATAHAYAMAALGDEDLSGYVAARAQAEALLHALIRDLEAEILGET